MVLNINIRKRLYGITKIKKVTEISKKKKIILLSDDLRMSSGVGTMSREIVMGTIKDMIGFKSVEQSNTPMKVK